MNLKRLLLMIVMPLVCFVTGAIAQDRMVTGKVIDTKDGSPLVGASVLVKGTRSGAQTTADGTFSVRVPANALTLVISSIGYSQAEVNIASEPMIVSLTPTDGSLNEVVVVGYGTQRKKDLTGSVVAITSKDFNKGQVTTPEQLIAGKVAGVQITSNSGAPGAGSRIRIRGGSSLNANNDPLIVIDGVPIDNSELKGAANALNLINPNDIESFNILKDASATAIYGSRASNGVIIITTKKGKKGKPVFNFNTQLSVANIGKKVDVLGAQEFRNIVNIKGSDAQKALLGTANTNWQDEVYQTALATDNNLSVSGSLKNMPYRISIGYLDQEGTLKTGLFKRTTAGLNLSPKFFNDHLRIDLNVKGAHTKNKFANIDAVGAAVAFDPTQPVETSSKRYGGYFEWLDVEGNPNLLAYRNPVALLNMREDRSTVQRSIGNIQIDYKLHFLPELRANLNLGYDIAKGEGRLFVPDSAALNYTRGGISRDFSEEKINKLLEFYLNYTKDISFIKSRIDIMAGHSYQDFITDRPAYPDNRADGTPFNPAGIPFKTQNTLISFYGRLNYALMNRYLLTFTLRNDGSSRFSEDNRWGLFPSVAFAWNVGDESFLKNSATFSNLKLRLGYGITGQQDVGIDNNYPYLPAYALSEGTAQYQFGENFYTMYRPVAYDANIKWEETETYNAGIDFGFADNRITGSIDYYFKKTKDLLNTIPVSVGSNFSNEILTNIGNVENKGIEITINTVPVRKSDFSLDVGFNFTYNKNEITKLTKVDDPNYLGVLTGDIAGATGNKVQIHSVGYNTYSFFVYKQVYDQNGNPIENVYEDLNGDGTINESDRYRYKSSEPNLFLGLSSQLNYKKWNAGFIMRGSFNNYMYNNVFSNTGTYRNILNPGKFLSNASINVLESNFEGNDIKYYMSDYYIENASFLRMDNIFIGYNVGKVLKNRATLRVNANVQNAFVITKYKGLDPEIATGIDNKFYPRPTTYSLGLGVDF